MPTPSLGDNSYERCVEKGSVSEIEARSRLTLLAPTCVGARSLAGASRTSRLPGRHNAAAFDLPFLRAWFERAGFSCPPHSKSSTHDLGPNLHRRDRTDVRQLQLSNDLRDWASRPATDALADVRATSISPGTAAGLAHELAGTQRPRAYFFQPEPFTAPIASLISSWGEAVGGQFLGNGAE